ncbi:PQ loop repeat protein [Aureobasidium pullulans]|uniref:PQ loop repeat protein n=1 Tax=Aureobasidium pullulans TaxID=5580 RepID=A0A4T0BND9_AURPU|nr:PQ loop repeat protein [Aureobasidium pullulans]
MNVPVAANVLGTLGAVCWSVQLIPQIIINYRRHNATGLQPSMMMFWAWAGVPLGVYNITSSFNIALQIQPQILSFLSLATWIQVYYYEKKWSVARSLAVVVPIASCMAGIEVALIFALRIGEQKGVQWPRTLMAVLAALFLALGVLAHYWDIYTHRTVRGISFTFCFIDALGDLTSLISVFFQPELDVLGIVIYGVELVLWLGIFACGGYYNLRPWLQGKMSARAQRRHAVDNGAESTTGGVYMHDLPSSTSAFRTSSAGVGAVGLRDRQVASHITNHTALQG